MQRSTTAALITAIVVLAAIGTAGITLALTEDSAASPAAQLAESDARSITVSAQGQAEAQPDKAVVRLGVEATAPDATTARTQAAENLSNVKQALIDMGIEESDIRTTDYRIYQDRERPMEDEKSAERVFHARHTLQVEVSDVETVGAVIDTAVDAGATDVHNVRFTLADETRQELRNQALTAAMENARTQADTLATSADLSIVGVHDVTTHDYSGPVVRYEATAQGASGGTDISSGPVSVSAQVTVTYNATE